jgi:outer membrane protein assembly factor BamB
MNIQRPTSKQEHRSTRFIEAPLNFVARIYIPFSDCREGELVENSGMDHKAKIFRGILALMLMGVGASAAEWPQYRGFDARGIDDSKALPTNWNTETGENIRWKTEIPGLAHSSPILWGDRVYVTTAVMEGRPELKVGLYGDIAPVADRSSQQWRVLALDSRTGKVVWNMPGYEGVPKIKRHPKATHCNSTPATDGKRIVAIFGSEGLFCFDMEGKPLWKKDLGPMDSAFFMSPTAQWGFASSPVIRDGRVIVLCDVLTNSFVAAFDIATGDQIWRTERKDVPTWGTPTVVESAGRKQIVVNGWHFTGGYDFATGLNLWHLDGGGDIPVPTPVFANGLIYLTSGHGNFRPMRAIKPDASGNITPPGDPGTTNASIAWAHARQGNYMQTPIAVGDRLYACYDIGVLTCFDAKTGAIKYGERLSTTAQGYTSSPVSDGRHIYIASEIGQVFVVPVADKFSVAAMNPLHEVCMATPAIGDGAIYYRTENHLIAVGAKR